MPDVWKTVRVFISSTFRDMHAERDHIVKVVFPALRERLDKHRIYLDDIDLRWGVTKEQAESDQILGLCLNEIGRCKPFFIGILGERYGTATRFPEDAFRAFPWIQEYVGRSVTELEILHGVLNTPSVCERAFFYFRDPRSLDDVPEAIRRQTFAETEPNLRVKLADLKRRIRASVPASRVMDPYRAHWDAQAYDRPNKSYGRLVGLEAFGERVREQLWEAIKAEHNLPDAPPPERALDPLAVELDYHERFMDSRLRVHETRVQINDKLLVFAENDTTVSCLVTGPSGSGKSASLSRFVRDYETRHQQEIKDKRILVIPHFIGASPRSTNLREMLWRFCQVLKARLGLADDVPEEVTELTVAFREFVGKVPPDLRVLFVIDALDQLNKTDRSQNMTWLPVQFPPQVKVVVSCISDSGKAEPALEAFARRQHNSLTVSPLDEEERRKIMQAVPSLSAKAMDDQQIEQLLANPATTNPLFLLVALEELRGFGSYERLNERIAAFPREGDTVTAIFTQVIERLESDFDRDSVRRVLSWLAVSRTGLTERELVTLLAQVNSATADQLFPILRQIRTYTLRRGELIGFFHAALHQAVLECYVATPAAREASHRDLATLFDQQYRSTGLSPDRLAELPFHLDGSGNDGHAPRRLGELARAGFDRLLFERTHDLAAVSRTHDFFCRAYLRTDNLPNALALAEDRGRVTRLGEWLLTGDFAPLLPYLQPGSPLWAKVRSAIAVESAAQKRIESLTTLAQPGCAPEMYDWLLDQYDLDAGEKEDDRQRGFLTALVKARPGAFNDVFLRTTRIGADAQLITALVEHLCPLAGARARLLTDGMELAMTNVETFVAMADAIGKQPDAGFGQECLTALAAQLPRLSTSEFVIGATAALAHSCFRCGQSGAAQRLAARCLELIPRPGKGSQMDVFSSAFVDAGVRLALAVAPFPDLWQRTYLEARRLAGTADNKVDQAAALAGFLRVCPWIAHPGDRAAWLRGLLAEVRTFAELSDEDDPIAEFMARFGTGGSAESVLLQPIEEALTELLADAHRLLADDESPEPLGDLLLTVAAVSGRQNNDKAAFWSLLRRIIPPLAGSASQQVARYAFGFLVSIVAENKAFSNDAGTVLEQALARVSDADLFEAAVCGAERSWCQAQPKMYPVLVVSVLRAIATAGRGEWLNQLETRLADWVQRSEARNHHLLALQRVACLLALGRRAEAEAWLAANPAPAEAQHTQAIVLADALAKSGAKADAAALLRPLLVEKINLGDLQLAERHLKVASRLVALGDDKACQSLLLAARRCWGASQGEPQEEAECLLLNRFHAVADQELIRQLLTCAERALLAESRNEGEHASSWYLALALSAASKGDAAQKLWDSLTQWREQHHVAGFRSSLLALLQDALAYANNREALQAELDDQFHQLKDSDLCHAALALAVQLVSLPFGPGGGISSRLEEDILSLLFPANGFGGSHAEALASVCWELSKRIGPETDGTLVAEAFGRALGPAGNGSAETIEQLVLNFVPRLRHLKPPGSDALLQLILRAMDRTGLKAEKRQEVYRQLAQTAASCPFADRNAALRATLGRLDDRQPGARAVTLAFVYQALHQSGASPTVAAALAEELTRLPCPRELAPRVQWLSALLGTPLTEFATPIAQELWDDLDQFRAGISEFRALEPFLCAMARVWPGAELQARCTYLCNWAAQMPPFCNEDWRPQAFAAILAAANAAPPAIQSLVLERAFAGLAHARWEILIPHLNGLTPESAARAVELWLDAPARADRVLELMTLLAERGWEEGALLDAVFQHMDGLTFAPTPKQRNALARIAEQCQHTALHDRLPAILDECYLRHGLGGLEEWDLRHLARRPVEWWIEQLLDLRPAHASQHTLKEWVEWCARVAPSFTRTAMVFSASWLSATDRKAVPDFFFHLATSKAPITVEDRLVLARLDEGSRKVRSGRRAKPYERPCLLCVGDAKHKRIGYVRGKCAICRGSGSIRGRAREDSYGQYAGHGTIACPVCSGRGRCYRCRGRGEVTVPPASPDGLVATVLEYLGNDQWPAFLAKYEKDRHPSLADQWGGADLRCALAERVGELGDEDLMALQLLEFAKSSQGLEFNNYKTQIQKRLGDGAEPEALIGVLAEFGFIKVGVAAGGSVVEVVIPKNHPQRNLLREILRLLRDEFGH